MFLPDGTRESGTVQQCTITQAGTYRVTAYGAQGGSNNSLEPGLGGLGAEMSGDFVLNVGEILDVYVGQHGGNALVSGGGGGGTFIVIDGAQVPLVVAGGGGGAGNDNSHGINGQNASTGTAGVDGGLNPGSGGKNGNGGLGAHLYSGGGGFYSEGTEGDGMNRLGVGGQPFPILTGGRPDCFGGGFGNGGSGYLNGGYGGGGASCGLGGGGGGYSGGGAGTGNVDGTGLAGGGGGSYLDPSVTNAIRLVGNTGDGYATINSVSAVTPEPKASVQCALGFLILAGYLSGKASRRWKLRQSCQ
jgi:hypothetical protein